MDVPAEEEGRVSAKSGGCNEVGPCRSEEELDECGLRKAVSIGCVDRFEMG